MFRILQMFENEIGHCIVLCSFIFNKEFRRSPLSFSSAFLTIVVVDDQRDSSPWRKELTLTLTLTQTVYIQSFC